MNPIQGFQIPSVPPPPTLDPTSMQSSNDKSAFRNLLVEGINQVNTMQQQADKAVEQLMTGEDVDPASVLTSIQKADMSFRMMMQIRNKLMQAYQEIKDMRI